jgi:hypothetical protein
MSLRKSVRMMTNTGTNWNVVGEPVRGDAWYGYTDSIHTVQVVYQNLVGGFGLQGTLALDPKPEDWFWIKLNPIGDNQFNYLPYPRNPIAPTGDNGGDTGSEAFTFMGNFVFLRAVLDRSYVVASIGGVMPPGTQPTQWSTWQWGQIDKVMLSL